MILPRWIVAALLLGGWATSVLAGPESPSEVDVDASLAQAREYIYRDFQYDKAIEVLQDVVDALQFDADRLRESYLLLIEAYVLRGNSLANEVDRDLHHEKAKEWIRSCLSVPQLRDTVPPPGASDETVEYFDEIRREMFGTFEITRLEPPDAEVVFEGETLTPDANGVVREMNVPIGTRMLVIRHPDYQDITEDVEISPNTVVSRPYALRKNRGLLWYATRVGTPVVAVAGVLAAVLSGGDDKTDQPEPLPGPPDPPQKR
jgi:hypothetical protein